LFGEWIPDEWILKVFDVCVNNPKHRYFFLTKNPNRYNKLANDGLLPTNSNMFYGTTITNDKTEYFHSDTHNTFLSIEPIQEEFSASSPPLVKWVIIGQETGNRKDRVKAKAEWIEGIYKICNSGEIPVFMKNNLSGIVENLIQEDLETW
jgi:protein gp37